MLESLAETDEELLELYAGDDEIPEDLLLQVIRRILLGGYGTDNLRKLLS